MINDYSSGAPPNSLRLLCSITGELFEDFRCVIIINHENRTRRDLRLPHPMAAVQVLQISGLTIWRNPPARARRRLCMATRAQGGNLIGLFCTKLSRSPSSLKTGQLKEISSQNQTENPYLNLPY